VVSMLRYDELSLERSLRALPAQKRAVFALACTERLRPLYGYPTIGVPCRTLDVALELLRQAIGGGRIDPNLPAALRACETELDPDDDAVAAAIFTYQAFSEQSLAAAKYAARRGYDARDRMVLEALPSFGRGPKDELAILSSKPVQDELRSQAQDLTLLAAPDDKSAVVLAAARTATGSTDAT
jgi:hypothetical protein